MELSSNQNAWIMTAVVLIHSTVVAWIIIKLEAAKDKEKVMQEIKKSIIRFFIFASSLFSVVMLFFQFSSPSPITRLDLLSISLSFIIIFSSLSLKVINAAAELFLRHIDQTTRQIDLMTKFIDSLSSKIQIKLEQ